MDEQAEQEQLASLLEFIRDHRGFDFTGYKRASLVRRIARRIDAVQCADFEAYQRYLSENEPEFNELFNTILINVTSFFRDRETWDEIARTVVPNILSERRSDDPIRVWVPGCASGEEAFTIVILLSEAMGDTAFSDRVKLYATDIDDEALTAGRHATFSHAVVLETLGEERVGRHFEVVGDLASLRPELRRSVIFGRHDLLSDPPISRIDLLSCRNTLMYFTVDAQLEILKGFRFALRPDGFLVLGRSETLAARGALFAPADLKRRIFVARGQGADHRYSAMRREALETHVDSSEIDFRVAGFELGEAPQILIGATGVLSGVNQKARALFGLTEKDVGRPLQDLQLSYRPLELRSRIDAAVLEKRQVTVRQIEIPEGGGIRSFDATFSPIVSAGGEHSGISISFVEVTLQRHLEHELDSTRAELDTAYEELQSTVEELETTNEELQSTNEELETTNEELQSTNEELETMNEELQSTNEELQTINDELRQRTDDLNELNSFLESILTSWQAGVIVVNREVRVQVWNEHASEMWGLRADEVEGEHLMNLDIGLPVEKLRQPIRSCLAAEDWAEIELELDAVNRRGRAIRCQVVVTPLRGADGTHSGAILVMNGVDSVSGPELPRQNRGSQS